MKKFPVLGLLTMMVLALALAAGCAKKPAPTPPAETTMTPVTPTTEMPSQQVSGIGERSISEQAMGEQPAMQTMAVAGLERIYFDFDQYTLSPQAREILAANATFIQTNPGTQIRIEGHCDERGSDEYNLALGERRAQAALTYLVSLGIAKERLSTISYGEEMPLDPSRTEDAWAKNRRAEFKVLR